MTDVKEIENERVKEKHKLEELLKAHCGQCNIEEIDVEVLNPQEKEAVFKNIVLEI